MNDNILKDGHAWELVVRRHLNRTDGIVARMYGQELIRDLKLHDYPTALRHDPDLVARCHGQPMGVDAKYSGSTPQTGNHVINDDSMTALIRWQDHYHMPVMVAFNHPGDQIGWLSIDDIRNHPNRRPGPRTGNGSGKPYQIIPCTCRWPKGWSQPREGEWKEARRRLDLKVAS